jgi:hypothetical protein
MSMLLLFVAYQYINTRANLNPSKDSASLKKVKSDVEGSKLPVGVSGVIDVRHSAVHGYNLTGPNISLWADELHGRLVCRHGAEGVWQFYSESRFEYDHVFDVGGMFLLFFMTALFTSGLTGFWPLLVSLREDLGFLGTGGSLANPFSLCFSRTGGTGTEEELLAKKHTRVLFKYLWLIASFTVIVLFSGVVSHFFCASVGWPTIVRLERRGECYFLETGGLGVSRSSSRRPSAVLPNLPAAKFSVYGTNGQFDTNCERSVYQAGDILWTIVPPVGISCEPIVAYQLVAIHAIRYTKCGGGAWKPNSRPGTEPGYTLSFNLDEDTDEVCAAGYITVRNVVSVKIDETRSWQKCRKVSVPSSITRTLPNGEVLPVEGSFKLTFDPSSQGRDDGWYTSGDKEILVSVIEDDPPLSLVFEKPQEGWVQYIRDNYVSVRGVAVVVKHFTAPTPEKVSLRCEEEAVIPDLTQYHEFLEYCSSASASLVPNTPNTIEISTASKYYCLVEVGFGSNDVSSTIVVSSAVPQLVKGVDRWRCSLGGLSCGESTNFTLLSDDLVSSVEASVVDSLGAPHNDVGNYADLEENGDPFGNLHQLSTGSEVIMLVGIALASVALVAVILGMTVWFVDRQMKKKKLTKATEEGGDPVAIP